MAECKSCHLAIEWTVSPTGAALPMDVRRFDDLIKAGVIVEPAPRIVRYSLDRTIAPGPHAVPDPAGQYVSHFVTCATRDQHRKASRPLL